MPTNLERGRWAFYLCSSFERQARKEWIRRHNARKRKVSKQIQKIVNRQEYGDFFRRMKKPVRKGPNAGLRKVLKVK